MARFSLRQRVASFAHAWRGAGTLIRSQHNARIHLFATAFVVVNATLIRVSRADWALLAVAIAGVWVTEAMNTAVELLADEITLERRSRIRQAKDVAAFAVLVSAGAAVVIGAVVFGPYLMRC
jgi:diacylglycerol kinase